MEIDVIAPVVTRRSPGARHIFPFGLSRQAVALPCAVTQPLGIGHRIVPAHVDDRAVTPAPTTMRIIATDYLGPMLYGGYLERALSSTSSLSPRLVTI